MTIQGASPEEIHRHTEYLHLELAFNINLNKEWPDIIPSESEFACSPNPLGLLTDCLHRALEGNRRQETRKRGLSWIKNLDHTPQSEGESEAFSIPGLCVRSSVT